MLLSALHTFGPYGFLRTLLIILVIFYAFRLIMRYLGPWILKKGVDQMTKKAEEQMRAQQGNRFQDKPEGTITVEQKRRDSRGGNGEDGEYVDFEEVK